MTKQKKNKRRYGYTEIIFFAIYFIGISFALMYVLCRSYLAVCGTIMSAFTIGVGALFYALRKYKGWSALAAFLLIIACSAALSGMPLWGEDNFMDFVFTSSTFFNPLYAAVCILCFGSVIGFVVCYFAAYSPRPCFVLLPAFIPLILSARTAGGIPEWILIIMLVGYAMSAAGISRPISGADLVIEDKQAIKKRRLAIAAIGLAAVIPLAVIPRSSKTIYGSKLDEVFSGQTGGYYMGTPQLTNFLSNSSVNRGANNPLGNLLFVLRGKNPYYLNRWSYDIYNGAEGWTTFNNFDTGYADWEEQKQYTDPAVLVYKLKNAAAAGMLEQYGDLLANLPYSEAGEVPIMSEVFSTGQRAQIQVMDGSSTSVILHPETTYEVMTIGGMKTYRTERGEIFTETDMNSNSAYSLVYFCDEPNEEFIRMLETVDYSDLIFDAWWEEVISDDEYTALKAELTFASAYQKLTKNSEISDKIRELAAQITEGLTSDYDKALAIEKWFAEAGFVYDMDFVPMRTDSEYFLFSSRRGICSDFATATTLLARAAGLTARYSEGYYIPESLATEAGVYAVTDANAHAYTSVYIEGYGWLTVDATRYVPAADDGSANKTLLFIAFCGLAVIAVLVIIFRRGISELLFSLVYRLKKPEKRVRALYKRTCSIACSISGKPAKSASVGEVCGVIRNALGMPEEAGRLQSACDRLFYGDQTVSADTKQLFADYRAVRRMKRRLKK